MIETSKQHMIQESQYTFPYHFIPYNDGEVWRIYKHLWWGYEYLSVLETISELISEYQPKRIIDFGCGDGRMIRELCNEQLDEIVGIDISEAALLYSKAMIGRQDQTKFYKTLKEVPREWFDAAIAMEVLEHIQINKLRAILVDVHAVLKPKGIFVISVPTHNAPLNPKHYRHFTVTDIEREIAGLFAIDQICFIHKIGMIANLLRRAVCNKFVIPTWEPWLKLTTALYKRYVLKAKELDGAHLISVLRKI